MFKLYAAVLAVGLVV